MIALNSNYLIYNPPVISYTRVIDSSMSDLALSYVFHSLMLSYLGNDIHNRFETWMNEMRKEDNGKFCSTWERDLFTYLFGMRLPNESTV